LALDRGVDTLRPDGARWSEVYLEAEAELEIERNGELAPAAGEDPGSIAEPRFSAFKIGACPTTSGSSLDDAHPGLVSLVVLP
jgi:hypothetical protein